jgi:TolB-like protein
MDSWKHMMLMLPLRINAQLVDPKRDKYIWQETLNWLEKVFAAHSSDLLKDQ